jgi:thiol-disulfide isomerase/thioredoxin/YHS domain-containing protein
MSDSFRGFALATALGLICTTLWAEPSLPWEPTLESAQQRAAQSGRLVYAHFWAPWCGPCRRMEAEVFQQSAVADQVSANYVPVKIDADQYPELARRYGIVGLPTEVILTPQGQLIHAFNWRGQRINAATFVERLNQVAAIYRQQIGVQIAKTQGPGPSAGGTPAPAVAAITPAMPTPTSLTANPGPSLVTPAPAYGRQTDTPKPNNFPAEQGPTLTTAASGISSSGTILPPNVATASTPAAPSAGTGTPGPARPQNQPQPATANTPPAKFPMGLDKFCPVTLLEKGKWVLGDRRYGVIHRGRTYLFVGPEEQRRFRANPDLYAPMNSGYDVVLFAEQHQAVSGQRQYGVTYAGHVFLFADQTTRTRFEKNPLFYAKPLFDQLRANASPNLPPAR